MYEISTSKINCLLLQKLLSKSHIYFNMFSSVLKKIVYKCYSIRINKKMHKTQIDYPWF